jgi:hypothetical protein
MLSTASLSLKSDLSELSRAVALLGSDSSAVLGWDLLADQ